MENDNDEQVLAAYEKLLEHSSYMLALATKGLWPTLIEEGALYLEEVEALLFLEKHIELDDEARARKAVLLESILEHSLEIKAVLAERQEALISYVERQRGVHHL